MNTDDGLFGCDIVNYNYEKVAKRNTWTGVRSRPQLMK